MAEEVEIPIAEPAVAESEFLEACQRFNVINQEIEIDVNFHDQSISGTAILFVYPMIEDLEDVRIDARQCEIDLDRITVDGYPTTATYTDPYDRMRIPEQWGLGAQQHESVKRWMARLCPETRPDVPISVRERQGLGCVPVDRSIKVSLRPESIRKNEPQEAMKFKPGNDRNRGKQPDEQLGVKISIPFRSKDIRDGLQFVGVNEGDLRYPHVYTRHSSEPGTASCIFPCIDDAGSRHSWTISIKFPRTLGYALGQHLLTLPDMNHAEGSSRKRKHGEDAPAAGSGDMAEEDKVREMTVICSGNLVGEHADPNDETKKVMTFECDNTSSHNIGFTIGPFEHVELSGFRTEEADEKLGANAAKIHGYCLPGRVEEVELACHPVVAAADYFALEFGRFPFESYKICFVDDLITDTVAVRSMAFSSSRLLRPSDLQEFDIENTRKQVHALACQYIGIKIVPNQRSDSWLVIGLQWFMTDLFMRTICGTNWYKFFLKTLSDKLVEADVGRPSIHELGNHLHLGDFEMDFMALKAPLVLFILDQRMSKFTGSTGVTRVISQLVMKANTESGPLTTSITTKEFRKTCEKKSQYRTEEFWKQWVMGAGCPRLNVKQRFNKKNLNVDISINQIQVATLGKQPPPLSKENFWREYQEEIHGVYAGEVQPLFTGPFTVRIHEADGTPYEHYLEIREDDKDGTSWSIAYNTKYKRLKRTKKRDGGPNATNALGNKDMQEDDVVFFNSFGDVLTTEDDESAWGLRDWSQEMQNAMDLESYEWIRFDCNFEWLCDLSSDMPGYMYLAQLQQDKDVVAHQDAMLYLSRGSRHDMAATIETRTLYDRRYYHGIRAMAAHDLPKHATPDLNYIGLAQLILMYRHFFCSKTHGASGAEVWTPAPNDFSDQSQYHIQCAILAAVARTRERGRCSKRARHFLLDLLLFNDNSTNVCSDQIFIANLLEALTTSLLPDKVEPDEILIDVLKEDEHADVEFKKFLLRAIDEIDKYRRMDEWTLTYQNIWTRTVLNCKMRLMKARVIPTSQIDFVQYLQDENLDLVRIKAFECLVELGLLVRPTIASLMLRSMTTDYSPFVRDRLFKIFSRGVAAIALGHHKPTQKEAPVPDVEEEGNKLIIDHGDDIIEAKKREAVRHTDITSVLAALRAEMKSNSELQALIWTGFNSTIIGVKEKQQLLELCQAMFEPDNSFLITLNYPKRWRAERIGPPATAKANNPLAIKKKQCWMRFTSFYKTDPKTKFVPEMQATADVPAPEVKPPEPKKIKLARPSISVAPNVVASTAKDTAPVLPVRQPSVSLVVSSPAPVTPSVSKIDTIAVQPARPVSVSALQTAVRPASPAPIASVASVASPASELKRPKPIKKRKSDEPAESNRPKKFKTGVPRKMVRLPFKAWHRLRPDTLRSIRTNASAPRPSAATIVASPVHKRVLSSSSSSTLPRSPVPTTPSSGIRTSIVSTMNGVNGNGNAGGTPAPKPRKPLPSSTPSNPAATVKANPVSVADAPPSRKITLKVKPRSVIIGNPSPSSQAPSTPTPPASQSQGHPN